jgi:protein TIF31
VPRNKPVLPGGEVLPEANTSPKVMNPHAAEFVPGQSRSPNGHPGSPNESLASPAGIQASLDGLPSSPDSPVESPKTASPQVSESGETSPEGNDTSSGVDVEAGSENKNTEKTNHVESEDGEVKPDIQTIVSEGAEVDATAPKDVQDDSSVPKDAQDDLSMTEKPKSWADYSDGEVEAVQVAS